MSPELVVLVVDIGRIKKKVTLANTLKDGLALDRYLRRGLIKKRKSFQTNVNNG